MSGIRLLDCSKLVINQKNNDDITICQHDIIVKFFDGFCFFAKFSYWTMFHVNIITGSGVFFYKRLTRNLEIGNSPVWVLSNTWRLGRVGYTKFGTYVSNKMLLNAAKRQVYSFYCFWVIKIKPTGVVGITTPLPPGCPHRFHKNFQDISKTKWKNSRTKQQNQVQLKRSVPACQVNSYNCHTHILH